MIEYVNCPLCKVETLPTLIHSKLRYGHVGKILQCGQCGFVYLYPRLSDEKQKLFYETLYRDEYQDLDVFERFTADHPEATRRLQHLLSHLEFSSLLEIGSGSGAFLSLVNEHVNHAVGVELDKNSQTYMKDKGLEIYGDIKALEGQKFDIIVMFHVLEHLLNPAEFLQTLKANLNPKGKIVIEVPNIQDALLEYYQIEQFKDFYFCSAHVSYFSKDTLRKCIEMADLNAEVSYIQRYDFTNHLNWLLHKKPGGLPQNQHIFSSALGEAYSQDLVARGLSDTLWAIAKN